MFRREADLDGADRRFQQPVTILLGPGGEPIAVRSTRQAAELLTTQWPTTGRGPRHRDAVNACLKVLGGHRSTVDARNALIEAAEEAGISADENETAGSSQL
jgi:hypothetical protein